MPKLPRRKADFRAINEVRKLQENPELGEFRIHAALLQIRIKLSPRTCGRILALNRSLYGFDKPKQVPREPKPMPFAATRRHQYWTVDVRYLDMHQLGGGIFKAKEAMRIYAALSIRKEQIDKKQAWQSFIETHFNVQRRMADWHFAHAETWV